MNPNGTAANLTPFQPGVSGNPGGRPRKRPQSEANDDLLRMEIPPIMLKRLNTLTREGVEYDLKVLKKGATWADAIALGLGMKAIKGDATAAKELRESVEGKSITRVEISSADDRGFQVFVEYEKTPAVEKKLSEQVEDAVIEAAIVGPIIDILDPDANK